MTESLTKWRRHSPDTAPAADATPDDVAALVRRLAEAEGMIVTTDNRYGVWFVVIVLGAPPNIAGVIQGRGNTEPEALAAAWAEHLRVEANRETT